MSCRKESLTPRMIAVARQGDLRVVDLSALLGGGDEVLRAVLDPLDRPLELEGDPGDEHLFRIEHHDLGAEAAADERGHQPHLVLGEAEHGGEAVAHGDGSLGGVPDRELLGPRVPLRDHAPVLDRRRGPAVVVEAAPDHHVGLGPGGLVIPLLLGDVGREVRADVLMDERGAGLQRLLHVHHRRQRLVVDLDVRQRVLGHVAGDGHDHGDGLAELPHLVLRQRDLRPLVEDHPLHRRRRHEQRAVLPVVPEILRRVDRDHPLALPRPRGVDPEDAGMGVRAAQEGDVKHPRQIEVVHEQRPPGEQAGVLVALGAGADGLGRHGRSPSLLTIQCLHFG